MGPRETLIMGGGKKGKFVADEGLLGKGDQAFFFRTIRSNMDKRLARVVLNNSYHGGCDF